LCSAISTKLKNLPIYERRKIKGKENLRIRKKKKESQKYLQNLGRRAPQASYLKWGISFVLKEEKWSQYPHTSLYIRDKKEVAIFPLLWWRNRDHRIAILP